MYQTMITWILVDDKKVKPNLLEAIEISCKINYDLELYEYEFDPESL